jgi:hypothetical protein
MGREARAANLVGQSTPVFANEDAVERWFYLRFLPSGIPTQVVKPSVSRAYGLQGTALTVFVEPSGPTTLKPEPVSTCGSGPVEYGFDGPGGPYAPV